MKRLAFLLVSVMLAVSIGVAVTLSAGARNAPVGSLPSELAGASEPGAATPQPSAAIDIPGSFAFGVPNSPSPSDAGQSRLWFQDGLWWGVFLTAATGDQRIFRLDPASSSWIDTGVIVDDRTFARMDVLWDGERLVVASAGPQASPRHALRIVRFSYDPATRTYLRDANFPLPITEMGVAGVMVARSDDGRLWVAYREGLRMAIDHSLDSDLAWRGPFAPAVAEGSIDQVAIASLGNRVAVIWTRPTEDLVFAAWHDLAGPEDVWQQSPDVHLPGLRLGQDDLSLAADRSPGAERLFVAVRTSGEHQSSQSRLDPQVVVVELRPDADPSTYLVGRVEDQHAEPIILINADARELYVVAASPQAGGSIYYKTASLDGIAFSTGVGTLLVPATEQHPQLVKPTSTKQVLDDASGIVIAATDTGAGVYGFGALGVGEGTAANPPPSASVPGSAPLIDNTFDGLAVGAPVPGWIVEGEPPPSFVIRVLSGSDASARLSSTATDSRACVVFGDVSTGTLRVEAEMLTNVASEEELLVLQVRGTGGEVASIRLRNGEVVYNNGTTRVRTALILAPGRWYRFVLSLDLAAQTFSIDLRNAADNSVVLQASALGWRSTTATVLNRLCAELPPQPGLDLYLNDVRVTSNRVEGS